MGEAGVTVETYEYVADYVMRRMLRPDCRHGISLLEPCGTCEREIQEGIDMGLAED